MHCNPKELYQLFKQSIYALILKRVRDSETADELTSETFARVCQCNAEGKQCDNPKGYLYRIALNILNDHYKFSNKQDKRAIDEMESIPAEEGNATLNYQVAQCIVPLLSQLPEIYYKAVLMADIGQIPQAEIARTLGLSLPAAKSRIQRGRLLLKKRLLDLYRIESDRLGNIISCSC